MFKYSKQCVLHLLYFFILVAVVWPATSFAHGGGEPRLTNAEVGPYRLYLWSLPEPPRVGDLHFSVAVTEPDTRTLVSDEDESLEAPILDADVKIVLKPVGNEGDPIMISATHDEAIFEMYYEADTQLLTAGKWQATVSVAGPEGEGNASFELDLLPARMVNWTLIVGAGIGIFTLIGLSRFGRQTKRTKHTGRNRRTQRR